MPRSKRIITVAAIAAAPVRARKGPILVCGFGGCARRRGARWRGGALLVAAALIAVITAPAASALSATPRIYWALSGNTVVNTIGEANLDGTGGNQSFITGAKGPSGVAVDAQHIYWANSGSNTIGVANLGGTDANQSFITGASSPSAVAVDAQRIYWANAGLNTIGVANLDGTGANQSFITGVNGVSGLAVDGQHIYWAIFGSRAIGEANLDGTGVNPRFITGGIPAGVAVDGEHIYWSNAAEFRPGTIGVANLDGTGVNQNFITQVNPEGLAVDDSRIYWTSPSSILNTIGAANLDGTGVNQSLITTATGPVGVAVSVPVAHITPASPLAFAITPQGTLSNPLALMVSNTGQRDLSLHGLSFSGPAEGDFVVSSNSCLGPIAPGESCQITVNFAPHAQGQRAATLQIASNDYANSPLQVPLQGTGVSLPAGPQGPAGVTGPPGPAGAAGHVELITCKTVTKTVNGHRRTVQKCTGRQVSGTIKFTASTATDLATISHGHVLYATGVRVQVGDGQTQLLVSQARPIRPGQYTLTVRARRHNRPRTRQQMIQID